MNLKSEGKDIFNVLDTFAGAGGFSLGFQNAGCTVVGAIELDKWACETFQYNHPNASVIQGDITAIADEMLRERFGHYDNLIVVGGPPCQGYSICNSNAGDPKDPRNSLFQEFLRVGRVLKPICMVMENVPNLLNAKTTSGESVIEIVQQELKLLGFQVYSKVLSATDYGIPQIRQRLFVIAARQELPNPFPQATHRVAIVGQAQDLFEELPSCPNLWDAISDLPPLGAGEGSEESSYAAPAQSNYQKQLRNGDGVLFNHKAMNHTKRIVDRFAVMRCGDSINDVPDEHKPRRRNSQEIAMVAYDQNNRRMHPHLPCHTIPASFYANFVHPFQNRNFTPREGARLQSFPDAYRFLGKPTVVSQKLLGREGRTEEQHLCQYAQIGNAVPPLLAQALAANLLDALKMKREEPMFVHGKNLEGKEKHRRKYIDKLSKQYLKEIRSEYDGWRKANLELKGPGPKPSEKDDEILTLRVDWLNKYKEFVDQQKYAENFDSRSNLHSSILEEFMYYLFKDLAEGISGTTKIGKGHSLKDFFFRAPSFAQMLVKPSALIEKKDYDFAIGSRVYARFKCKGAEESEKHKWDVPALGIECKTYLDKTMLQDAAVAAQELRRRNPNALYIVVAEWLKLAEDVNLEKQGIDQIYILRKQKNTDREFRYDPSYKKNPIYPDTVIHLFKLVRKHLTSDWQGGVVHGLERGFLMGH